MSTPLKLWLDAEEYMAIAARHEAERAAAHELDARILAEWALEDSAELQIAA